MSDEKEIDLQQIAEVLDLEGVLAEASRERRERLREDPEWFLPRWTHLKNLVEAFAHGCISADVWHKGYRVPPNLETVLNHVAAKVWERWGEADELAELSLVTVEEFFRECVDSSPECLAWNEPADGSFVGVVTRYSPVPERRDFIDLDALIRNAAVYLRNERRRSDEFDRKFDEQYGTTEAPDA